MVIGYALFVIGYALVYWGYHHFTPKQYSLWTLLGFGTLFGGPLIPMGQPFTIPTPGAAQQQNPNNNQTPNNLSNPSNVGTGSPVGQTGAYYPVSPNLTLGRTDQGVDWSGSGPLYAVNSGKIINVYNSGWPGGTFIVLQLDNWAGLPSPDVYYAEDITPAVTVGQHVNAGDLIGTATGGSSGIELGWADPKAIGAALARSQFTGANATPLGQSFLNWITKQKLT